MPDSDDATCASSLLLSQETAGPVLRPKMQWQDDLAKLPASPSERVFAVFALGYDCRRAQFVEPPAKNRRRKIVTPRLKFAKAEWFFAQLPKDPQYPAPPKKV